MYTHCFPCKVEPLMSASSGFPIGYHSILIETADATAHFPFCHRKRTQEKTMCPEERSTKPLLKSPNFL